jgi:hypothetical protein
MMLSRYRYCGKLLAGSGDMIAEIGASDRFGTEVVEREVGHAVATYDYDPVWEKWCVLWNIVNAPLPYRYDGIYMLDVLEHIHPEDEPSALKNICTSLRENGVFIAGVPSLESQVYASETSKIGHVNCRTGEDLKRDLQKYFHNVFVFSQNDEMIHLGFYKMAHYLLAICTGKRS